MNYYDNFTYTGKLNFPVDFEYTFKLGDDLLQYSYSKSPEGKLEAEKLVVNNKLIFCNKDSILTLDEEEFQMEATVKTNLANNANNVSIINFLLTSYPLTKSIISLNYRSLSTPCCGSEAWRRMSSWA